jgi:hypothetical protein
MMPGPKKDKIETTRWRTAAQAVLSRQPASGNKVAGEIRRIFKERHDPRVINRWLSGDRTPDAQSVAHLNAAIGSLVSEDAARKYLDSAARRCGLLDAADEERLRDGCAAFELVIDDERRAAFDQRFIARLAALDRTSREDLLDELYYAHQKLLFDAMGGRVRYEAGLDRLQAICHGYGIDLDNLCVDEEFGTPDQLLFNARWRDALANMFATFFPDSSAAQRFGAQRAIERALGLHPAFATIGALGPAFLNALWRARESNKPLKWPPKRASKRKKSTIR